MLIRAARPVRTGLLLIAAASIPAAALAFQDQPAADSRIEIVQVGAPTPDGTQRKPASKAFLDRAPDCPPAPRPSLMQTPSDQIARAQGSAPASQITARTQSGSGMAQLSKSELEATLAQLSAAERRVLLQAIEGSDICDNPPQVAAVIALCQSRLETRSQEFAAMEQGALSAEEQLLRGEFDNSALPSVSQVIDRLARTSAASNDFNNQAIASIALGAPPAPHEQPRALTITVNEHAGAIEVQLIGHSAHTQQVSYTLEVTGQSTSRHRGKTTLAAGATATLSNLRVSAGDNWCVKLVAEEPGRAPYEVIEGSCAPTAD